MGTSHVRLLPVLAGIATLCFGCGPKVPPAPPEFDVRAMTGSTSLERDITDAIALQGLTEPELAVLREEGLLVGQEAKLSRYIAAVVGQGELQAAVDFLHARAWEGSWDEVRTADALALTLGQLQWGSCAQIARAHLERHVDRDLFLVRALCLQRSGDPQGAIDNVLAAADTGALPADLQQLILAQLDARGASVALPPAEDADFTPLRDAFARSGPLGRLFVTHLMGRDEPWVVGSLDWGGFDRDALREVVLSRSRSYRHCHALASSQAGRKGLSGEATITWTIDALGRVDRPSVMESSWGGSEHADWLDACLIDQVSRLRFPRTAYGLPMPGGHRFSYRD